MKNPTQSLFQPVIKWSGSKRTQAYAIAKLLPDFRTYYEPFLGGGSVLYAVNPKSAISGDVCKPLIDFWNTLQRSPKTLIESYKKNWEKLDKEGYLVYYEVRERFNNNQNAHDLLFLTRTCVNGLIRFNKEGKFNNSLHHTRKGINPDRLADIINDWSKKIKDHKFIHGDYQTTTVGVTKNDFIYLDPPYFNTNGRYYGRIELDKFILYLENLNQLGVKYALSLDGQREDKDYTIDLPKGLYKRHIYLKSGNSSFKKVQDKKSEMVHESLYLNW